MILSVSDILKLLDEIPIWKAISSLPKRVAALEQKIAALEGAAAAKRPPPSWRDCLFCPAQVRVIEESDDPVFGAVGGKALTVVCDNCGALSTRQVMPGQ